MTIYSPLQVVIFSHINDIDTRPYQSEVASALQGANGLSGYFVPGEDLGIQLKQFDNGLPPPESAPSFLDGVAHTFALVFADHNMLNLAPDTFWEWLATLSTEIINSNGRHSMMIVAMDERAGKAFGSKHKDLSKIQLLQVWELGEEAARPGALALNMLHRLRMLLAKEVPPQGIKLAGHLRIFISHAKIDGLPLAYALKYQIKKVWNLETFYDVDDISKGHNWEKALKEAAESSLMVILRTNEYDGRDWCQKEVLWADLYTVPAIVVDARTHLGFSAGALPFEGLPAVRIPDGNLSRILLAALREGLRFLIFVRRAQLLQDSGQLPSGDNLIIFGRQPGMAALLRACGRLAKLSGERVILYPDPPLRSGQYEAARALISAQAPGVTLTTPHEIATLS